MSSGLITSVYRLEDVLDLAEVFDNDKRTSLSVHGRVVSSTLVNIFQ